MIKKTLLLILITFSTLSQLYAQCTKEGIFVSDGPTTITKGSATMSFYKNGVKELVFSDDFKTTNNGPDLYVILCKNEFYNSSTDVIISGVFTKIQGSSVFTIPEKVGFMDYNYVLVHCIEFNHRFAYALLDETSSPSCEEILGVNNFSVNSIVLFPNPIEDKLTFVIDQDVFVNIYSILGEVVINNKKVLYQDPTISLSFLKSGIYFVEISDKGTKNTYKVLKK